MVAESKDIKTRIHAVTDYMVGFGEENDDDQQAFIFIRLQGLSGRTETQKNLMTDSLSKYLQSFQDYTAVGLEMQLCVEFAEMPRDIYRKVLIQK